MKIRYDLRIKEKSFKKSDTLYLKTVSGLHFQSRLFKYLQHS